MNLTRKVHADSKGPNYSKKALDIRARSPHCMVAVEKYKHTPEVIEKIRAARKGKGHSPETLEKLRKPKSATTKEKMSIARKHYLEREKEVGVL